MKRLRLSGELRTLMLIIVVAAILCGGAATILKRPRPRVTVANAVVNVGSVPQMTVRQQTWTIRNDGNAPLRLIWMGSIGCSSCARLKYREVTTIPAGGSSPVVVDWSTGVRRGRSRLGESFVTNDPETPSFALFIDVNVTPAEGLAAATAGSGEG
jgi:hypothetical protein